MTQNQRRLWQSPRVVPGVVYDDVLGAIEWLTRAFGYRASSGNSYHPPGTLHLSACRRTATGRL